MAALTRTPTLLCDPFAHVHLGFIRDRGFPSAADIGRTGITRISPTSAHRHERPAYEPVDFLINSDWRAFRATASQGFGDQSRLSLISTLGKPLSIEVVSAALVNPAVSNRFLVPT